MPNAATMTDTRFAYADTPMGRALLVGRPGVVTGLYVADHDRCPPAGPGWVEDAGALADAIEQLDEYSAGERTEFDLELDPTGTPFQLAVWAELRRIPFGETIGYGELARRVGRPGAARAVGAANGRNPISVVVPCHRVIGSDGTLTGYGWGTDRKARLLDHERSVLARHQRRAGAGGEREGRSGLRPL